MIKFSDIKIGDFVMGEYEGKMWEGEVTRLNGDEKQVEVRTDVQEFWFEQDHIHPIPLNEEQLLKLNFKKQDNDDGTTKYMKGSFRIVLPQTKKKYLFVQLWHCIKNKNKG